jgi:hypothetical protein
MSDTSSPTMDNTTKTSAWSESRPKFVFVEGRAKSLSQRDRALLNSEVRAHAAFVSHNRSDSGGNSRCSCPAGTSKRQAGIRAKIAPRLHSVSPDVPDRRKRRRSPQRQDAVAAPSRPGPGYDRTELYKIVPYWIEHESMEALDFSKCCS